MLCQSVKQSAKHFRWEIDLSLWQSNELPWLSWQMVFVSKLLLVKVSWNMGVNKTTAVVRVKECPGPRRPTSFILNSDWYLLPSLQDPVEDHAQSLLLELPRLPRQNPYLYLPRGDMDFGGVIATTGERGLASYQHKDVGASRLEVLSF